jgi:hypothetical protein
MLSRTRVKTIPGPGSGSASKNSVFLTQKTVSELLEKDLRYSPRIRISILPIPDPGVKKAPDPGSGSATLFISFFKDRKSKEVTTQ